MLARPLRCSVEVAAPPKPAKYHEHRDATPRARTLAPPGSAVKAQFSPVVILSARLCENSHGGRKRRYQYHSADRDRGSCAIYERRFFWYHVGIRVFTQSRGAKNPRHPV